MYRSESSATELVKLAEHIIEEVSIMNSKRAINTNILGCSVCSQVLPLNMCDRIFSLAASAPSIFVSPGIGSIHLSVQVNGATISGCVVMPKCTPTKMRYLCALSYVPENLDVDVLEVFSNCVVVLADTNPHDAGISAAVSEHCCVVESPVESRAVDMMVAFYTGYGPSCVIYNKPHGFACTHFVSGIGVTCDAKKKSGSDSDRLTKIEDMLLKYTTGLDDNTTEPILLQLS